MAQEVNDIDEQLSKRRSKGAGGRAVVRNDHNDGGFRRLIDALLVVGVASLIAVVWNLSNTVSILTTQVSYMSQELTQLRARLP